MTLALITEVAKNIFGKLPGLRKLEVQEQSSSTGIWVA